MPRRTEKLKEILAGRKSPTSSSSRGRSKAKTTRKRKRSTRNKALKSKTASTCVSHPKANAGDKICLKSATADTGTTTEPLSPKVEYSPNRLARCCTCRKKIRVDQKRYGIPEHNPRYNREIYRYYHYDCCPANLKSLIPSAADDLQRQKNEAARRLCKIRKRQELLNQLRMLRTIFANRLKVSAFLVFPNATLDELVYKMPSSESELLGVRGIGPVKCRSFGDSILRIISQYKPSRRVSQEERKPASSAASSTLVRGKRLFEENKVICIDCRSDDVNDLAMGETLTCEELVNRKFAHAAANGYMISID